MLARKHPMTKFTKSMATQSPLLKEEGESLVNHADEFRRNAEDSRKLAQDAKDPKHRDLLLVIAGHWERLAREAERNPIAFLGGDGL
jgi:hypothetical protein